MYGYYIFINTFFYQNERYKQNIIKKVDYNTINSNVAHFLFYFLTATEKYNRSNYKFYDVEPNLKFVDLIRDSFDITSESGLNQEIILKNLML
jgi:hypothetical protein